MATLKPTVKAGLWVSLGLMLGRLTGFFREGLLATHFGATHEADLAVVTFLIPDFIAGFFVGISFNAVLVPEFSRLPPDQRKRLFSESLLFGILFALVASSVLWLFPRETVSFWAPGLSGDDLFLLGSLFRITIWSFPLAVITGVVTSYLQAEDRFFGSAMGTGVYNGALVAALSGLLVHPSLSALAWAVVAGALARLLIQLGELISFGRLPTLGDFRSGQPRALNPALMVRCLQVLGAALVLTLMPILARQMGSYLESGTVAVMSYSVRIVDVPLAVVAILPSILLPRLSRHFASSEGRQQGERLASRSIYLLLVCSLAVAIPAFALCTEFASQGWEWRKFSRRDLGLFWSLTAIRMVSLPVLGLFYQTSNIFNSRGHTRIPFLTNLAAIGLFLPAAWFLKDSHGAVGILLAWGVVDILLLSSHVWILKRQYGMDCFGWLREAAPRRAFLSSVVVVVALSLGGTFLSGVGLWASIAVCGLAGALGLWLGIQGLKGAAA